MMTEKTNRHGEQIDALIDVIMNTAAEAIIDLLINMPPDISDAMVMSRTIETLTQKTANDIKHIIRGEEIKEG